MDEAPDISDSAILADVTAFLAQGTESQKKQLCRFLRAQSSYMYSAPDAILPAKELAVKLGIIERLHKYEFEDTFWSKPTHFSYIQLASLCLMSAETLQKFLDRKATNLYRVLYPEDCLNTRMDPLQLLMSNSNHSLVIQWKHPAASVEDGRRGLPFLSSSSREEREKVELYFVLTCQTSIVLLMIILVLSQRSTYLRFDQGCEPRGVPYHAFFHQ